MRMIHTSDWHLGRTFCGQSLLEDQAHQLAQFCAAVREDCAHPSTRPDLLIIAGDIYDRAVPPKEAVALLSETLQELTGSLKIPTVIIAGNHDSPERIGFASELLQAQGLTMAGPLTAEAGELTLATKHGPVRVFALPFASPVEARRIFGDETIRDHAGVIAAQLATCRPRLKKGERSVVVAHAFVMGSTASDSEEDLSVGGAFSVESELFKGFDYTALGHLHRPQKAGSERLRYSGSLLKYSFSEADHTKGFLRVELGPKGTVASTFVPLVPRREMRILEGCFDDLLDGEIQGSTEDYLLVRLLDGQPVADPMTRLRARYPNILNLQWPNLLGDAALVSPLGDHRAVSSLDLFKNFFEQAMNEPMTEEDLAAYLEATAPLTAREA